jgi:hypothetical protein
MDQATIIWILISGVLAILQAIIIGGIFGCFRKLLDFEHRLSFLEGVHAERGSRIDTLEEGG